MRAAARQTRMLTMEYSSTGSETTEGGYSGGPVYDLSKVEVTHCRYHAEAKTPEKGLEEWGHTWLRLGKSKWMAGPSFQANSPSVGLKYLLRMAISLPARLPSLVYVLKVNYTVVVSARLSFFEEEGGRA